MNLKTSLTEAAELFIQSIALEKQNNARRALHLLYKLELYPIADPYACVGDLQLCSDDAASIDQLPLDIKLLLLLAKLEDDGDSYCKSVLFLIQFYIFMKKQCSEFKIPVGNIDLDRWEEYIRAFSRLDNYFEKKHSKTLQDIFKEFVAIINEQENNK